MIQLILNAIAAALLLAGGAHSLPVYGLAGDGVMVQEAPPAPTPTPQPAPTPTPEPVVIVPPVHSVEALIAAYPWPVALMTSVARCESGLQPGAYNETPVYDDQGNEHHAVGVFQVLIPMHLWRFAGASPYDAEANIRVAYELYSEQGLAPWAACL